MFDNNNIVWIQLVFNLIGQWNECIKLCVVEQSMVEYPSNLYI
jgi:hypothetical protein